MKNSPIKIEIQENGVIYVKCSIEYTILRGDIFRIKNHKGDTEKFSELLLSETKKSASCFIEKSGYYFSRAEILDNFGKIHKVESTSSLFIEREKREGIKKNLASQKKINIEKIPYFPSPDPQIDFLVEVRPESKVFSCDADMQSQTGTFFYKKDFKNGKGKARIYSSKPMVELMGFSEVFSGYAWEGNDFLFGDNDWYSDNKNTLRQLRENLGNYSYVSASDSLIEIGTDFLGFSRLFFYEEDGVFIVSNRYHLLLLFLKISGFSLSLDKNRIEALFLSNVTLFRQVMTHDLLVKNTYLLPSFYSIKIEDGNVIYQTKELHQLLDAPANFEDSRYEDIVRRAAKEIENNVSAVFRNPKFDRVIVDLSGGRDSRVGFAALTNIDSEIAEKARIRSTLHEPDDLHVAIQVNNIFDFPYHDEGDSVECIDPIKGLNNKRSYYLGYHFLWYCPTSKYQNDKRIRITGESFESLSVRYYSNVLRSPHQTKNVDSLVSEFTKLLSKQCLLDLNKYGDLFSEQLTNTLNSLPGQSAQEKFDSLFLLFRGSFHAGNLDRMHYEPACCMPLQSKNLLLAKRMWQSENDYNRVIYDITYLLNPILLTLPYNSKKTNAEFLANRKEMLIGKGPLANAYLKNITPDIAAWDEAYALKKTRDVFFGDSGNEASSKMLVGEDDATRNLINIQIKKYVSTLFVESKLISDEWRENILIPVCWYVDEFTADADEVRICHHKLATLHDLIAILQGS